MTEKDQEILDSIATIIPCLTHLQKEKLLSFGEGMACANNEREYISRIERIKKIKSQLEEK